jgi:uncharacterized protein GlcG (DUF336 family)
VPRRVNFSFSPIFQEQLIYLILRLPPVLFHHTLLPVKTRLLAIACSLGLAALPAFGQPFGLFRPIPQLALSDVQNIIAQGVARASVISPDSVIAVVDREGIVCGVWSVNGTTPSDAVLAIAIGKAGTASFLSSDQHAFTSRTAGFIVQQNFPPNVQNSGPGPLVGVNFSNLQFSDINRIKGPGSIITNVANPGASNYIVSVPQPVTGGLAGAPGGVPLYVSNYLVGGVGVSHMDDATAIQSVQVATTDEDVALAAQTDYAPAPVFLGDNVTINGFRLAYVSSTTSLGAVTPFAALADKHVPPYVVMASPSNFPYPTNIFGNQTCEIRQPIRDDPLSTNADPTIALVNGQMRLTAAEVSNILSLASDRARTTRAGIRLPRGQAAQVFVTVVSNPNQNNMIPQVLGTIRTQGATMFSWDVAIQKARTAIFFSSSVAPGTQAYAFSARAVGFLAEELFPPGINGTEPGIFWGLQERFSLFPLGATNPLDGVTVPLSVAAAGPYTVNPNLPNGITIFPGGFPLYRNGQVIGAIGVSGDGVDQDDIITASGTANFLAPVEIRSDHFFYQDSRLPYAKFPRNPAL